MTMLNVSVIPQLGLILETDSSVSVLDSLVVQLGEGLHMFNRLEVIVKYVLQPGWQLSVDYLIVHVHEPDPLSLDLQTLLDHHLHMS